MSPLGGRARSRRRGARAGRRCHAAGVDESLRGLERRLRATGSPEDRERYEEAALRVGVPVVRTERGIYQSLEVLNPLNVRCRVLRFHADGVVLGVTIQGAPRPPERLANLLRRGGPVVSEGRWALEGDHLSLFLERQPAHGPGRTDLEGPVVGAALRLRGRGAADDGHVYTFVALPRTDASPPGRV